MYDHTFYKQVQISRSDIRPQAYFTFVIIQFRFDIVTLKLTKGVEFQQKWLPQVEES